MCAFYNNARDGKPDDLSRRIANQAEGEKEQDWTRTLIQLVEAADQCIGRYEPIYRVWLAKLVSLSLMCIPFDMLTDQQRIKMQASQSVELSLVRKLNDFVAEITILLDPLQKQIAILESWIRDIDSHFLARNNSTTKFNMKTTDMVREAINSRKSHLELVQRLLQQGKDTQALVTRSEALEAWLRFDNRIAALSSQQH